MLTINDLSIQFGKKEVLKDINLQLAHGSIYGIVGLNGSGKSTFFNALFGYIKHQGTVLLKDEKLRRKDLAYLETENFFYSNITGKEYLSLFVKKGQTFAIHTWLDFFNLPSRMKIEAYSFGMRKKLAFIACIILDKEVMLLDEPFNGLDIEGIYAVQKILQQIKKDKIILVSSHLINSLEDISDRIFLINNQHIESDYDPDRFPELQEKITTIFESRGDIQALFEGERNSTDPS